MHMYKGNTLANVIQTQSYARVLNLQTHTTYVILYSDWFTSYLIRALVPYHIHLLLLLNHVVIVVKLCCVEGLMEDRCTSNKHSR